MVRMISINDRIYDKLRNLKGEKSFSQLLDELAEERKKSVLRFAGALEKEWKNLNAKKLVEASQKGGKKAEQARWNALKKSLGG